MSRQDVPKPYLVVAALSELGGEADLESIAVKVHQMFPRSFCWQRFPEYPDKDAVRVHLSDAKKAKFGGLVDDSSRRGGLSSGHGKLKRYALTPEGVEKARELRPLIEKGVVGGSAKPLEHQRLVAPILESEAFSRFQGGETLEEIGRGDFLLSMKLFGDASAFVIKGRLARALSAIDRLPESEERERLLSFVQQGRKAFDV